MLRDACAAALDDLAPASARAHPLASPDLLLDLTPGRTAVFFDGPQVRIGLPVPMLIGDEQPQPGRLRVAPLALRQLLADADPALELRLAAGALWAASHPETPVAAEEVIDEDPATGGLEPVAVIDAAALRAALTDTLVGVPDLSSSPAAETQALTFDLTNPDQLLLEAGHTWTPVPALEARADGRLTLPAPAARALVRLLRTRPSSVHLDVADSRAFCLHQPASGLTVWVSPPAR